MKTLDNSLNSPTSILLKGLGFHHGVRVTKVVDHEFETLLDFVETAKSEGYDAILISLLLSRRSSISTI